MKAFRSPTARRILFAVLFLLIVLTGAGNLLKGRIDYRNYKGFWVFAPLAILIGLLGVVVVIRRSKTFADSEKKPGRGEGLPTGPSHSRRKRRR
jgi:hypothetical protein